jgi:hypothetical protein
VAASSSGVPGNLREDAADIYRVMRTISEKLKPHVTVTTFNLAGYSLGGAEAAFVSLIDEKEQAFKFNKVLMINPPVSLYNSVSIIDDLLENNIPGGIENFGAFYKRVVKAFGETYKHGDRVEFNDEFLYETYKYKKPQTDEPLKALIGISFRLSCQNMVFSSDVMTKAGYVVSKDTELGRHDHVTPYMKALSRLTFIDYFKGIFLPHFQKLNPGLTESEMIEEMSLRTIEEYLRKSPKIGLMHNADDIILRPGEIDYLKNVFMDRAKIYAHGGHCGNMSYPENVADMVDFFSTSHQQ